MKKINVLITAKMLKNTFILALWGFMLLPVTVQAGDKIAMYQLETVAAGEEPFFDCESLQDIRVKPNSYYRGTYSNVYEDFASGLSNSTANSYVCSLLPYFNDGTLSMHAGLTGNSGGNVNVGIEIEYEDGSRTSITTIEEFKNHQFGIGISTIYYTFTEVGMPDNSIICEQKVIVNNAYAPFPNVPFEQNIELEADANCEASLINIQLSNIPTAEVTYYKEVKYVVENGVCGRVDQSSKSWDHPDFILRTDLSQTYTVNIYPSSVRLVKADGTINECDYIYGEEDFVETKLLQHRTWGDDQTPEIEANDHVCKVDVRETKTLKLTNFTSVPDCITEDLPVGTNKLFWFFINTEGVKDSCYINIKVKKVKDVTPPDASAVCPAAKVVSVSSGVASYAQLELPAITLEDPCDGLLTPTLKGKITQLDGTVNTYIGEEALGNISYPVGVHKFYWIFTDNAGLKDSCEMILTVAPEVEYLIENVTDFANFREGINSGVAFTYWNDESITVPACGEGVYFKLIADLDLSEICGTDVNGSEASWIPIGTYVYGTNDKPFKGHFDGDGHTIFNLYINAPTSDYQGLFGYIEGASIENLQMTRTNVLGSSLVGGVCAYAYDSEIINCLNSGSVSGSYTVGGVCGIAYDNSTISNCLNSGSVSGTSDNVGGVCGWANYNSNISNCFNIGSVSGSNDVGGVCGYVLDSTIEYCINSGSVSGSSKVGGVCGLNLNSNITGSYYDKQMCNTEFGIGATSDDGTGGNSTGAEGKLTTEMTGEALKTVLGETNWTFEAGMYPRLNNFANTDAAIVAATPVFLQNEETVNSVSNDFTVGTGNGVTWSSKNTQRATITGSNVTLVGKGEVTLVASSGNAHKEVTIISAKGVEIGTEQNPYTIDNTADLVAFRDAVNDNTKQFKGVTLDGGAGKYFKLTSDLNLNAICGANIENGTSWTPIGNSTNKFKGRFNGDNYTISNLYINASASDYQGLFGCIGGTGPLNVATIQNLHLEEADVTGKGYVGGLCGQAGEYSIIKYCTNSGSVSGNNNYVGGLCGGHGNNSDIHYCVNRSTVTWSGNYVGGISGGYSATISSSTIKYCLNSGIVDGISYVGGICGIATNIEYCINTGYVNGTGTYAGAVCGVDYTGENKCYFDRQLSNANGLVNENSALTTELTGEALKTVLGETNWTFEAGMYPRLKAFENTDAAIVAATPVFLANEETVNSVSSNFTVGTGNNVSWTSSDNNIASIANGNVYITGSGELTLTASRNGIAKSVKMTVSGNGLNVFNGTAGNSWNNASNWSKGSIPTSSDNVIIDANAVVDVDASVQSVLIKTGKILIINSECTLTTGGNEEKLIIEDGAQLIHSNAGIRATMKKNIAAYTSETDGWFTIASPVNNMAIAGSNFLSNSYDLYRYDEASYTWENYKNSSNVDFTAFENGRGYLYANSENITLAFAGELNVGSVSRSLTSTDNALRGFHLIGNPFAHKISKGSGAAIDHNKLADGYYVLTNAGAWTAMTYGDEILPGQGILVQATEAIDLNINKITTTASGESSNPSRSRGNDDGMIKIEVSNSRYEDVAYLSFGEGNDLDKISHRNEDVPMLYIHHGGEDYAIAHVKKDCKSVPVYFETPEISNYTVTVKPDMKLSYLHLTDNVTGDDIDLLSEKSYTFVGSSNDSPARFVLHFSAEEDSNDEMPGEAFAYFDGNDLIVGGISGKAVIDVIDVQGRILYRFNANGSSVETHGRASVPSRITSVQIPVGTYIIRKVDDSGVKNMKVVKMKPQ